MGVQQKSSSKENGWPWLGLKAMVLLWDPKDSWYWLGNLADTIYKWGESTKLWQLNEGITIPQWAVRPSILCRVYANWRVFFRLHWEGSISIMPSWSILWGKQIKRPIKSQLFLVWTEGYQGFDPYPRHDIIDNMANGRVPYQKTYRVVLKYQLQTTHLYHMIYISIHIYTYTYDVW